MTTNECCFYVWQAFINTGINLPLQFESNAWSSRREDRVPTLEFVDFEREPGKVFASVVILIKILSYIQI